LNDSQWSSVKLAGSYVVVASLWILVSDWLFAFLPPELAQPAQTAKGLLFVVVTGAVLYALVYRILYRLNAETRQARSFEALFAQVLDTVPVGVVFVNEDRYVTFMNPAAETLLSMPAAECIGLRLEELSWGEVDDVGQHIGQLLDTGSLDGLRLGRPDDPLPRAVIARAAAVNTETNISGWVIAIADVTRTQEKSERAERLVAGYRFLAECLLICSRARDPKILVSQVASAAVHSGAYCMAWAMLRPSHDAPFANVALVGAGEASAETARRLSDQVNSEWSIVSESLTNPNVTVSNDIARDPASSWHAAARSEGFGSAVSFGASGPKGARTSITLFSQEAGRFDAEEVDMIRQLQGALSFAFEKINLDRHRSEAERALERSEQDYRKLFVSHPSPLWVADSETRAFLAVNDAAVRKYGYTREEFARMTVSDIRLPADSGASHECSADDSEGFQDAGIWTHLDKGGREMPVHIYCHEIEWDGRPARVVMVQEVARMT
jgi:PAS domain S-box-containing protein